MTGRQPAPAYAARLARWLKRRAAQARGAALPLTFAQKTASEPRLYRTRVAAMRHNLTVQENNHARLL